MATTWQVGSYEVKFFGLSGDSSALIILTSVDAASFATLSFTPTTPLPPNLNSGDVKFKVHYPLSYLGPVLEVLREEQPVHFNWSATFALLTTGKEKPGEDEGP